MRMLVDAFVYGFEEDMLDGAMVLLLWSEMVRCQCPVRFLDVKVLWRQKDRDVCSLICDTVYYLRHLRIHNTGISWNIIDAENSFSPSRTHVLSPSTL